MQTHERLTMAPEFAANHCGFFGVRSIYNAAAGLSFKQLATAISCPFVFNSHATYGGADFGLFGELVFVGLI